MAYCQVSDLQRILPDNILIGNPNLGVPEPGRASTRSNLSSAQAEQYILFASQYIDSRIRNYYACPLRKIKTFETPLTANAIAGTNVTVSVYDAGAIQRGDVVRLQDRSKFENTTIVSITNVTDFIIASLTNSYFTSDEAKLAIVEYPDPVPLMTAQLAVSYIIDRLFVAEQAPNVSEYGKGLRVQATNSMNALLYGEILLFGQEHTGRRFIRGSLFDAYKSPAELAKGEEKE